MTQLGDDALGKLAWDTYSKAVGGKAFNGDPLPTWEDMKKDDKKQNLVEAWKKTAKAVADRVIKSIPKVASQVVAEAVAANATFHPGDLPPATLKLLARTTCCGANSLSLKSGSYVCPCGGTTRPIR